MMHLCVECSDYSSASLPCIALYCIVLHLISLVINEWASSICKELCVYASLLQVYQVYQAYEANARNIFASTTICIHHLIWIWTQLNILFHFLSAPWPLIPTLNFPSPRLLGWRGFGFPGFDVEPLHPSDSHQSLCAWIGNEKHRQCPAWALAVKGLRGL